MTERTAPIGKTIKMGFDPRLSKSMDLQHCWNESYSRLLMLLWGPGHMVGEDFHKHCSRVGAWLFQCFHNKPNATIKEMKQCLLGPSVVHQDFTRYDWENFCEWAFEYFAGKADVGFKGEIYGRCGVYYVDYEGRN